MSSRFNILGIIGWWGVSKLVEPIPLNCDSISIELCALILQEELGDYDSSQHGIETISEFRFLPDHLQTEQFEEQIYNKYSSSAYKSMTPAEAELTFLNK